jgi:hypothetical protein
MDAVVVGLGAVMLIAYLGAAAVMPKPGGRVIFGDATHHFVQLRSVVFDHDLDFRNDYQRIYGLTREEPGTEWIFSDLTKTGHVRNYMPVGPAILWAPLYLLVVAGEFAAFHAGIAPRPDGFGHAAQLVPGVTGILAAAAAAWLSWRLARKWVDAGSAALGVLAAWLGTSALYYSLVSPSYSHAASMFACALFFSHWLDPRAVWTPRRIAASAALASFASLMRWQDALLLGIPLFEALRAPWSWRARLLACVGAGAVWVAVFLPQMIVWRTLYGNWLALPQGPSFMQWLAPHPIAVLFSDNHGFFSWTPVAMLAVVGLGQFAFSHRRFLLPLTGVLVSAGYVNAAVADWWAGEAFGARRFLSLFPLLALGSAVWIGSPPRRGRLGLVAAAAAVTWLLLFQYEVFMKGLVSVAPYPKGAFGFWAARFVVPFRLIAHWLG